MAGAMRLGDMKRAPGGEKQNPDLASSSHIPNCLPAPCWGEVPTTDKMLSW